MLTLDQFFDFRHLLPQSMDTIIVNQLLLVQPHNTAIVRLQHEAALAMRRKDEDTSPTHSKITHARESWPCLLCSRLVLYALHPPEVTRAAFHAVCGNLPALLKVVDLLIDTSHQHTLRHEPSRWHWRWRRWWWWLLVHRLAVVRPGVIVTLSVVELHFIFVWEPPPQVHEAVCHVISVWTFVTIRSLRRSIWLSVFGTMKPPCRTI